MAKFFYSRPDSETEPGAALYALIEKMRGGDVLVAPSADHLAHRWRELKIILDTLGLKAARFEPLHMSGNSGDPTGKRLKADLRRAATSRARLRGSYANNPGRPKKLAAA